MFGFTVAYTGLVYTEEFELGGGHTLFIFGFGSSTKTGFGASIGLLSVTGPTFFTQGAVLDEFELY